MGGKKLAMHERVMLAKERTLFCHRIGRLSQPTKWKDFLAPQECVASAFERSLISIFILVLVLTSSS